MLTANNEEPFFWPIDVQAGYVTVTSGLMVRTLGGGYQIGDADQIDKIAVCLADNFVKPLFDFHNEKKYQAYVKSLAEILNWSSEFYKQYYQKLNDWKVLKKVTIIFIMPITGMIF